MEKKVLDLQGILNHLPYSYVRLITNIKSHCGEEGEFIIEISNRKILNKWVVHSINKYLEQNNMRSYFYEGLVSLGNGKYSLNWSS